MVSFIVDKDTLDNSMHTQRIHHVHNKLIKLKGHNLGPARTLYVTVETVRVTQMVVVQRGADVVQSYTKLNIINGSLPFFFGFPSVKVIRATLNVNFNRSSSVIHNIVHWLHLIRANANPGTPLKRKSTESSLIWCKNNNNAASPGKSSTLRFLRNRPDCFQSPLTNDNSKSHRAERLIIQVWTWILMRIYGRNWSCASMCPR